MRRLGPALAAIAVLLAPAARAQGVPFNTEPQMPQNAAMKISPHVFVIMGFPNVGIVVGSKATLVVDTGLGDRNGALVAREAARLSPKGNKLYLTTTHFHPEHASGQGGFPAGTVVVRNRVQQEELEADGPRMLTQFSNIPQFKPFVTGAGIGKADELYDSQRRLDLGGVHVSLYWFGHAHTKGDEIIDVEEDALVLPGDVIMSKISPNFLCDDCSPRTWIAVVDRLAALKPRLMAPDHGPLGDGKLIPQERAFLQDLQDRSMALKREGKSAQEAGQVIQAEFKAKYPDWLGMNNLPQGVAKAYADKP